VHQCEGQRGAGARRRNFSDWHTCVVGADESVRVPAHGLLDRRLGTLVQHVVEAERAQQDMDEDLKAVVPALGSKHEG